MVFKKILIVVPVIILFAIPATHFSSISNQLHRILSMIGNIADVDSKSYDKKFSDAISKIAPSIATIESFIGGRLLKIGNGLVLTQDGLVITLNSLVPSSADFYQVFIDGRLNQGRVVFRNSQNNLAIMDIGETGLLPANLLTEKALLPADTLIINQYRDVGSFRFFVNDFSSSDGQATTGVLVDQSGVALGLTDTSRSTVRIINSDTIEKFFLKYYSSKTLIP